MGGQGSTRPRISVSMGACAYVCKAVLLIACRGLGFRREHGIPGLANMQFQHHFVQKVSMCTRTMHGKNRTHSYTNMCIHPNTHMHRTTFTYTHMYTHPRYLHTSIHICSHTYFYIHTPIHRCTHLHSYIHTEPIDTQTHIYTHTYIYMHLYTIDINIDTALHIYPYIHMHLHINSNIDTYSHVHVHTCI